MTEPPRTPPAAHDKDLREERLAEALRANLKRRKAQARARDAERKPEPAGTLVSGDDLKR